MLKWTIDLNISALEIIFFPFTSTLIRVALNILKYILKAIIVIDCSNDDAAYYIRLF